MNKAQFCGRPGIALGQKRKNGTGMLQDCHGLIVLELASLVEFRMPIIAVAIACPSDGLGMLPMIMREERNGQSDRDVGRGYR